MSRLQGIDLLPSAGFPALLLFLLCLLIGAMVLEEFRGRSRGRAAEQRAVVLLKQWLSPAQLAQYRQFGHFEVTGCHSSKRYRIRQTHQMNVDELDENGMCTVAWCFGPEGELPIGDVMLAQKIALENDEVAALAVANRGHLYQSPSRFG